MPRVRPTRDGWLSTGNLVIWPVWCALLCAVFTLTTGQITLLNTGFYTFQTTELVLLSFVPAIYDAARTTRIRTGVVTVVCCLFLAVWLFSFLRGLATSPSPALTSARVNAIVPMFIVLSLFGLNERQRDGIFKAIHVTAVLVSIILVLRLLFGANLFYQISFRDIAEVNDGGRGLTAQAAVLLAGGAIVSFARAYQAKHSGAPSHLHRRSAAIFTGLLLLSFQGSATLAGAAGLTIVFALAPGHSAPFRRLVLVIAASFFATLFLLAPEALSVNNYMSLLPPEISDQLRRRTGNFDTRSELWSGFLATFNARPDIDQLFGLAAGQREQIVVQLWGGIYWEVSLHSGYYGLLSSVGYFGLAAFMIILVTIALAGMTRIAKPSYDSPYLAPALVAMLLVYAVGYDIRNEQGVFVLLAVLSVTLRRATVAPQASSPAP
jgi:hypothetical protein